MSAEAVPSSSAKGHKHETLVGFATAAVGDRLARSANILGIQSRILLTRFGLAVPKVRVGFSTFGARGFFVDDSLERADHSLKKSTFDDDPLRNQVKKNELFHRANEAGFYHIGLDSTHARTAYYETIRVAWHKNVEELVAVLSSPEYTDGLSRMITEGEQILSLLPDAASAYRTQCEKVLGRAKAGFIEISTAYPVTGLEPFDQVMVAFDRLKRMDALCVETGRGLAKVNRLLPKKVGKGERAVYKENVARFRLFSEEFRKSKKWLTLRNQVQSLGGTAATLINSGRELLVAQKNLLEMRDARKDLRQGRERIIRDSKAIEVIKRPGTILLTDALDEEEQEGDAEASAQE